MGNELEETMDKVFIEYDLVPKEKRELIPSDKWLTVIDKNKNKHLVVKGGDIWTKTEKEKLQASKMIPLIMSLLKI